MDLSFIHDTSIWRLIVMQCRERKELREFESYLRKEMLTDLYILDGLQYMLLDQAISKEIWPANE